MSNSADRTGEGRPRARPTVQRGYADLLGAVETGIKGEYEKNLALREEHIDKLEKQLSHWRQYEEALKQTITCMICYNPKTGQVDFGWEGCWSPKMFTHLAPLAIKSIRAYDAERRAADRALAEAMAQEDEIIEPEITEPVLEPVTN